jgi:amidase
MKMTMARRRVLMGAAALGLGACAPKAAPVAVKTSDALGDLDGVALAARIRSKEITALEAVDAAIARADAVDPAINAIVTKLYDRARADARKPAFTGPFGGVPTFIKDLNDIEGAPTKNGSRAFARNIAKQTDTYVARLLAAGLIPIGKSTTPEFGFTCTTEPLLTGPTRNPWNLKHSAGGSSGGSGALVAARVVPVAHANDGGGSIRIPASVNGLFGFKPSRRRMVGDGERQIPVDLAVENCVSISVRDSLAWFCVGERGAADAPSYPALSPNLAPLKRKLRIGYAPNALTGRAPDPDVLKAVQSAAALCQSLGHEVKEYKSKVDGAAFADAFALYWASAGAELVQQVTKMAPGAPIDQLLEPLTLGLAKLYQSKPPGSIEKAIGVLKKAEADYAAGFADVDVILTPTLAMAPLPIGEIAPDRPFDAMWAKVFEYCGYTPLENAAGAPAMSVPLAWNAAGLPIGIHFTAAKGEDALLYQLAFQLEAARPWAKRKPPTHA